MCCKDASILNLHQHDRRGSVEAGSHSTGSTFGGLRDLVAKMRPYAVIKDRPPHGGTSNFDAVKTMLRGLGYDFIHDVFDVSACGLPHRRPRLWMAAVYVGPGGCSNEGATQRTATDTPHTSLPIITSYTLGQLLFRHGDAFDDTLKDWWPEVDVAKPPEPDSERQVDEKRGKVKWPDLHETLWRQLGASDSERADTAAQFNHNAFYHGLLSDRQQDICCQLSYSYSRHGQDEREAVWDLLGNANRVARNVGAAPCLLPRSACWMLKRRRILAGVESLILQGADIFQLRALRPGAWANQLLQNLGGNAFCTGQLAMWLLSVLIAAT